MYLPSCNIQGLSCTHLVLSQYLYLKFFFIWWAHFAVITSSNSLLASTPLWGTVYLTLFRLLSFHDVLLYSLISGLSCLVHSRSSLCTSSSWSIIWYNVIRSPSLLFLLFSSAFSLMCPPMIGPLTLACLMVSIYSCQLLHMVFLVCCLRTCQFRVILFVIVFFNIVLSRIWKPSQFSLVSCMFLQIYHLYVSQWQIMQYYYSQIFFFFSFFSLFHFPF